MNMTEIERLYSLLRKESSSAGTLSTKWWKEQWYTSPLRRKLRSAYNGNLKRYLKAYARLHDETIYVQESGMQYFAIMEHKDTRRSLLHCLSLKVQLLLDSSRANSSRTVFMALDFECGNNGVRSIDECGIATFSDGEKRITTIEFATQPHARKLRFGETVRDDPSPLKARFVAAIFHIQRRDKADDILLVGHGIIAELRILETLQVDLSDLPISGIADAYAFAQNVLSVRSSLGALLSLLGIPMQKGELHCAANDAYFTMQLLLALLSARYEECSGRWNGIITCPLPSSKNERGEQED